MSVDRTGTVIRTDLTAVEWRKVQRLAKRERLTASQWVGRAIRNAMEAAK